MSHSQRPWWLWASKSHKLTTTVREESTPAGPLYTVRGEPVIQGLTWLVWGPLSALVVILALTGLAIVFEARAQSLLVKAMFILAFLGLPPVVWGGTIVFVNRISGNYLQAEREAEALESRIQLDLKRDRLQFSRNDTSSVMTFPFKQINQVKVTEAIGGRGSDAVCLALETEQGRVILLDDRLGTEAQKYDLAREIQAALTRYSTTVPHQKGDGHVS